MTVIIY